MSTLTYPRARAQAPGTSATESMPAGWLTSLRNRITLTVFLVAALGASLAPAAMPTTIVAGHTTPATACGGVAIACGPTLS